LQGMVPETVRFVASAGTLRGTREPAPPESRNMPTQRPWLAEDKLAVGWAASRRAMKPAAPANIKIRVVWVTCHLPSEWSAQRRRGSSPCLLCWTNGIELGFAVAVIGARASEGASQAANCPRRRCAETCASA
jgi:hypothetical protein